MIPWNNQLDLTRPDLTLETHTFGSFFDLFFDYDLCIMDGPALDDDLIDLRTVIYLALPHG